MPSKNKLICALPKFKVSKPHLFTLAGLIGAIFLFSLYLKFFAVLPQTAIDSMPELPVIIGGQRLLVLSPHCDDEILAAGGLIHRALQEKDPVRVVVVTDCNKHKIGNIRKLETQQGLAVEGLSAEDIVFLNFPEGKSSDKLNPDMEKSIAEQIDFFNPTILILPHPDDTHRDHEATGMAGDAAIQDKKNIIPLYYLIHYNFLKYPSPPGFHPNDFLLPPARLVNSGARWYKFSLTSNEVSLKEEAIKMYPSQLRNPILDLELWDFARRNELFMMRNN